MKFRARRLQLAQDVRSPAWDISHLGLYRLFLVNWLEIKVWTPGQTQADLAIAATTMGKLRSAVLHLPLSAVRRMDLSMECPHQTTLKPSFPNKITSPGPLLAEPSVVHSLGWYLRAGGAESPNCCWGVLCSPGHRTLCVRAVRRHRKMRGLEYFYNTTFPWSVRSPSGLDINMGLNSYACHCAQARESWWRGARLFSGHPGEMHHLRDTNDSLVS